MSWERRLLGPNSPASSRATSSIVPIRSISSPRRVLSRAGRAKSLGNTLLSVRFSFSIASIALSMTLPISGDLAAAWSFPQRASGGTQKTFSLMYSSRSSGSGVRLLLDLVVPLLEGVGDVLEEDQPEGDVLVLASVHVPAHLVRRGPELLLEPEIRTVARAGPLRPRLLLASHFDEPRCP